MGTRIRTLYKFWVCDRCDLKLRGDVRECPECGDTRDEKELRESTLEGSFDPRSGKYLGPHVATKAEIAEKKLGQVGPDWDCKHCGSGNRGDKIKCVCGAPAPRQEER